MADSSPEAVKHPATPPSTLVVMGVSGCGKSAIAQLLAARLGWACLEGDALHAPASIAKMRAGVPLEDDDRRDWLLRMQRCIGAAHAAGEPLVLACSALKRRYRDVLRQGDPVLAFVHLQAPPDVIAARMHDRVHFMPPALLASQFGDLEALHADERGAAFDATAGPDGIVTEIIGCFQVQRVGL